MKRIATTLIATIFIITGALATSPINVSFRVEKQAMSTPLTNLEEIFFNYRYYEKPVSIHFNGETLNMVFDNNQTFLKKEVTPVECNAEFYDEECVKRQFYTFKDNTSDTLMFVIDYDVPYIQLVLPTRNSKGEQIGYTSYQEFIHIEEVAVR